MILNKKGEGLRNFLKLILTLIIIFGIIAIVYSINRAITGSSMSNKVSTNLDQFMSNIKVLSFSKEDYSSTYTQILLPQEHYLVAFGKTGVTQSKDWAITKPSKCDKDKACFCIYNFKPSETEPNDYVVVCKNIDDIDYIIANPLFNEEIMLPSNKKPMYSFAIPSGKFLGAEKRDDPLTRDIYTYITENQDSSALVANYLGFYENPFSFYDFVVQSEYASSLRFYVELIRVKGKSFLVILPYYPSLVNRKYFIPKYDADESCKDAQFLHSAIEDPDKPGEYNYCIIENNKITLSEDTIGRCSESWITELCVCGNDYISYDDPYNKPMIEYPRAVSSGFCFSKKYPNSNDIYSIFYALPPYEIFCSNVMELSSVKCDYYKQDYTCLTDACNLGLSCKWEDNKCKKE